MVWIINRYTHTHSTEGHLKYCKVALKHSFQHPVFYALNQYFYSEIRQQKRLQHFWTGIKPITLTLKSVFTYSPFEAYRAAVSRWWTALLCWGLVTGCALCFCRLLHLSAGMSCGKVNLVSPPHEVWKKIAPTKRFLFMSEMWTAMNMRHKTRRDSNDLTVGEKRYQNAVFLRLSLLTIITFKNLIYALKCLTTNFRWKIRQYVREEGSRRTWLNINWTKH